MSDFRRQPSKVWWSSYDDDSLSRFSGSLGWGKGIDLSGNFNDTYNNNLTIVKNNLNGSKFERNDTSSDAKNSVSLAKSENVRKPEENDKEEEEYKEESVRKSFMSDRGSSSSPSQGSHKSQDSGFSDSEIQNNALSLSPECSPELSSRLSCISCKGREKSSTKETDASKSEKSYNETVANYRKLKTSVKTSYFSVVEFKPETYLEKENNYLETAFDGSQIAPKIGEENQAKEENVKESGVVSKSDSSKVKNRKNLIKAQISRTKCDTWEKINHIQNQLELSFKLPKKIGLPQNLKISNIFHPKLQDAPVSRLSPTGIRAKDNSAEAPASPNKSGVSENGRCPASPVSLDNEGFKVPKLPSEHSLVFRGGSNNFLDLTDIEGPPISSSTPKSCKIHRRSSPEPRAAKATEKKLGSRATFATIRKLKGLSEKKPKGPNNLLDSFNRCSSSESYTENRKGNLDFESSVKHWLTELETTYEAEIMTSLQSKSLAIDLTRQVTNMADTTSQTIKKLHQRTKIISSEFSKLCQQNKIEKHAGPLVQSLVGHITEFIQEYVKNPKLNPSNHQRADQVSQRTDQEKKVTKEPENCHEMITDFRQPEPETVEVQKQPSQKTKEEQVLECCEALHRLSTQPELNIEEVQIEVSRLGQKFREVVDVLLESQIQALVKVLEEPRTELALRTALSALTSLGSENNHLAVVVSKCGGIRAFLVVCLEARATAVRVSALRALATVCCVAETIRLFEQAGGVEILADILSDEQRSEAELSEAAAVIAQITAPWVQDNHSVNGLSQFLNSLVTSLTRIIEKYPSSETLLLSSAALANLTFMEPRTVWPLLENGTAKTLLTAVRRQGPKVSVFIQEQAATVIANMASVPECRKHLAEQRAVVALLCFLEIHHSPLQSPPEVTAAERVQQKSAIALSRLCSDSVVAKQVVELHGVNRLVRLCKEEKERNHSDGVLVACLAALRKIVANCGTEALEELNAMELVEPRLLDSFLLYSSKQESYV